MREAVRLRYKMFPYIYTAARRAYDTGISICRPLYYDYPEEANAYDYENEYMFGDDIFVSLIVSRSGKEWYNPTFHLAPGGKWWNVCRSELVNGQVTFTDNYAQNEISYFFKAGSIIPNYPVRRNVTIRPDTIILKSFPEQTVKHLSMRIKVTQKVTKIVFSLLRPFNNNATITP